jgi:acetyl-CoA carboxylase carboxyltransferase component
MLVAARSSHDFAPWLRGHAERLVEAVFCHIGWAASVGFIDEIIRPRTTRKRLIAALATLSSKRDRNPPKKHGNIPL